MILREPDFNIITVPDVVSDIVTAIKDSGTVTSYTDNGNGTFTVNTIVDKLYNYQYVTIDNINYQITNATTSGFDITSNTEPLTNTWQQFIEFYHGTPILINDTRPNDLTDFNGYKYPFIALFEPITSQVNIDSNIRVGNESELWLVFMTEMNKTDWTESQQHERAVKPMLKIVHEFINYVQNSGDFGEVEDYQSISHVDWGLVAKFSGHTKSLFSEDLSGVEVNLTLPILKSYNNCVSL